MLRAGGTMPVSADQMAITSGVTLVPPANTGQRRRTSPPSIHSNGTPSAVRLSR